MSDPQAEDSLYDSAAMRNFVGIDLGNEAAPDDTTICKFRHLIENNGLSKMMLTAVNDHLKSKGIKIGTGVIMDATAKGEHPLLIIKRIFGFTHVRYRGLAKNGTRFEVLCAFANLYMKRRVLMRYRHA